MNKRQYLEAMIHNINATLHSPATSPKMRANQERALRFYTMELEREIRLNDTNRR